jgi:hypothetical protein
MQPWAAVITVLALVLPFTPDNIERYWTRVKLTYGFAWLAICAWVFFQGHRAGLLGAGLLGH